MMRRLAEQGLITHEPYRACGSRRTAGARRCARCGAIAILECYLTEVLGYPWDRVHDEAEQLEHAASEELIERMAEALGNPLHDPHGARSLARGRRRGDAAPRAHRRAVGERARVRQVMDDDGERLRYLAELGIRPGSIIRLLDRAPFDGPITLWVGDGSRRCDARRRSRARRAGVRRVARRGVSPGTRRNANCPRRPRIPSGLPEERVTARPNVVTDPDTGIPDLIPSLTDDSKRLVTDEVQLAKLEAKDSLHRAARGGVWLALAFGVSIIMLVALTVFIATLIGPPRERSHVDRGARSRESSSWPLASGC
jgi:DtxR family Mn-dependent transcriptional regulator